MSILVSILAIGILLLCTYKSYRAIRINLMGPWSNAPPGPSTYPFLGAIPSLVKDFWGSDRALKSPMISLINYMTYMERIFDYTTELKIPLFYQVSMVYESSRIIQMHPSGHLISAFKSLSGGASGLNQNFDLEVSEIVADLRGKAKSPDPIIRNKQFDYLKVLLEEPFIAPLTIIPFALYIPPLRKIYNRIRNAMNSFRILLSKIVEERRKDNFTDEKRGFIDLFLKAQLDDKDNPYLKNAASEIRDAIQKDTQIKSKDRHLLPYTDAVLMEVRRYATPFPITPFRCSNKDIRVNGFDIPANVPVQVNLNGVLRSKYCWKAPDIFNPSRFLNEKRSSGNTQCVHAFRIWEETINLLHNFKFSASFSKNKNHLPSNDRFGGIIQGYEPFDVKIELR
ncbi:unnamed protein product [Lepeophtheirus salmonis]|uniref:(salmon louse) hypothetical protein n=1 Tax=Lepeophtheirus salmonis TaxID=72036 RepID=A0A7R8CC04_LEPSM|nr:unnamed protein product [Lepeophtheirus salmonis]CAF2766101.1 unnamed protein product [Lepeophtheirus salmonis]